MDSMVVELDVVLVLVVVVVEYMDVVPDLVIDMIDYMMMMFCMSLYLALAQCYRLH